MSPGQSYVQVEVKVALWRRMIIGDSAVLSHFPNVITFLSGQSQSDLQWKTGYSFWSSDEIDQFMVVQSKGAERDWRCMLSLVMDFSKGNEDYVE